MTETREIKRRETAQDATPKQMPILAHALKATPAETLALQLWVKMSRAHAAVATHLTAEVETHGLTLAEFAVLEALYHCGPMLLGEVQKRILVSSGGVTFLMDRLASKGLVERLNCPTDRRARYAALTAAGESRVEEIFPAHAATIVSALSGLTASEQEEVAALMRKLGQAAARLAIGSGQAPTK